MQKTSKFTLPLVAAVLCVGPAIAQQGSAPATPPASGQSSTSAAAKPQSGTAPKKATSTGTKATTMVTLKTQKDKESYAMGMNLGTRLKRDGMTLDSALVAKGMRDAMAGGKTVMTEDEARAALQQFNQEIGQKMDAKAKVEGAGNRKAGEAFLAANKAKPGVVTLPDGLQYKILKEGNGAKPAATDSVTCNYRGTTIDGKEFDSSYKRGQPATFPLQAVIKGWTEALQLMPVGSKWELYIPADMAYGDHPPSADIAPGSTLIFEVELLSIGEQKK